MKGCSYSSWQVPASEENDHKGKSYRLYKQTNYIGTQSNNLVDASGKEITT